MKRARWMALGTFALVFACQEPAKVRPPGLLDQGGKKASSPTHPVAAPSDRSPRAPVFDDLLPQGGPTPQKRAAASDAPEAEKRAAPTSKPEDRDLSAELLSLFPPPEACLDLALASQSKGPLVVSVEAMVMPSGRITRVNVEARGQRPQNLRCIEAYIGQRSLASDVPSAPISVRASLPLEVVAEEK